MSEEGKASPSFEEILSDRLACLKDQLLADHRDAVSRMAGECIRCTLPPVSTKSLGGDQAESESPTWQSWGKGRDEMSHHSARSDELFDGCGSASPWRKRFHAKLKRCASEKLDMLRRSPKRKTVKSSTMCATEGLDDVTSEVSRCTSLMVQGFPALENILPSQPDNTKQDEVFSEIRTRTKMSSSGDLFSLAPAWSFHKMGAALKSKTKTSNLLKPTLSGVFHVLDDAAEETSGMFEFKTWASRIMVHPNSKRRIAWDLFGFIAVLYDIIMIPLQQLDPPEMPIFTVMLWIIRFYWTIDFPIAFITGYTREDGYAEMRLPAVVRSYVLSWMPFDIMVLFIDWMDAAVSGSSSQDPKGARIMKIFKVFRLIRMLRIVKVVKMGKLPDFASRLVYKMQSESFLIILNICKLMISIVLVTHIVACFWYGIGKDDGDSASWVSHHDILKTSFAYRYTTSFHWGLTQFTGSMDIQPQNVKERSFAVVALLAAFLIAASVVSSITSSFTRLQIITARQSTGMAKLTQYLYDNNISSKVALRVQRNARYVLQQEIRKTTESDIEFFPKISEPLRIELHYEINAPVLRQHPFFVCLGDTSCTGMRHVCHSAAAQATLVRGDQVFEIDEIPACPMMYIVMSGDLAYIQGDEPAEPVCAGMWFTEAVLWTHWVHCGGMFAKAECTLLMVSAENFQASVQKFNEQASLVIEYATEFVRHLNASDRAALNDLEMPFSVHDLVDKVFVEHASAPLRRSSVEL